MSRCSELMKTIQMADFALVEAGLYLDSHPGDENAKNYYRHYKAIRDAAAANYIESCGPIVQQDFDGGEWKWVDQPFPWLKQANE